MGNNANHFVPQNHQAGIANMALKIFLFRFDAIPGLSALWLTALLLTAANAALAEDTDKGYQLGRGYSLGDTGIHLGGYTNARMRGFGSSAATFLNLDQISLFLTWDISSKLRYFSETEAEDVFIVKEQQSPLGRKANFRLERIYLDYLISDNITVRLGKFLTPIGQWNLIHANPLVWTTSRPVATTNLFSEHATGIMLQGVIPVSERFIEYSIYSDYSSTLDPKGSVKPDFDNAQGMRLRYSVYDSLQIGLSYADFALIGSPNTRSHLSGLDIAWSYQRFAVNSEVVYRKNDSPANQNAWQGYIQGVIPLTSSLYAVSRYEFFDQPDKQSGEAEVLGLAYRPTPPLVLKLEYRLGKNNSNLAPDGMFGSVSVLF